METMKNKEKIKLKKPNLSCPKIEESHVNSLSIALTFKGLATKIFFQWTVKDLMVL